MPEPMPQWMQQMLGNVTAQNNKQPLYLHKPKLEYNYTAPSSEDISQFAANSWPIEEEIKMRIEDFQRQQEEEKRRQEQDKIRLNMNKFISMMYTPSISDPEGTIKIKDTRVIDVLTGEKLNSKRKMHSVAGRSTIRNLINGSIERGIDPYTTLAIGMQETNLGVLGNPLQSNTLGSKYSDEDYITMNPNYKMLINDSLDFLKEKLDYGKKLGKKTDEEIIQAWNGYGKPMNNFSKSMYGIDYKTMEPMSKNPIYGRIVVNLRDSVIKKNPEIVKMVEEFKKFASEKSKK